MTFWTPDSFKGFAAGGGTTPLWLGILGAPIVWAIQFQTCYALVPWVCNHDWHALLWLVPLLAVMLTIVGGIGCFLTWQRVGGGWPSSFDSIEERTRFLAVLGMLISAAFAMLIVWQAIASFYIHPCYY
jgi:hypothetical protein